MALSGPFTTERFDDYAIKGLLEITDYGHAYDWANCINIHELIPQGTEQWPRI